MKGQLLKPVLDNLMKEVPAKMLIDSEKITMGFFYIFILKDFIIRELVQMVLKVT